MPPGRPREFDEGLVLSKAMELFWRQGYEKTGLSELLEVMGIARQSLYAAFGDKKSLFLKTLEHYWDTVLTPVLEKTDRSGSVCRRIESVFKAMLGVVSTETRRGCLLVNTVAELSHCDDQVAELANAFMGKIEQRFLELAIEGQKSGEIRNDVSARQIAALLVISLQGMALLAKLPENNAQISHGTKALLTAVRRKNY